MRLRDCGPHLVKQRPPCESRSCTRHVYIRGQVQTRSSANEQPFDAVSAPSGDDSGRSAGRCGAARPPSGGAEAGSQAGSWVEGATLRGVSETCAADPPQIARVSQPRPRPAQIKCAGRGISPHQSSTLAVACARGPVKVLRNTHGDWAAPPAGVVPHRPRADAEPAVPPRTARASQHVRAPFEWSVVDRCRRAPTSDHARHVARAKVLRNMRAREPSGGLELAAPGRVRRGARRPTSSPPAAARNPCSSGSSSGWPQGS
jgi:hypothetical protein